MNPLRTPSREPTTAPAASRLLETLDRRHFDDSIDDALADIARPARSG